MKHFLFLAVLTALGSPGLQAGLTQALDPACQANTLANLTGSACSVGILNYSNFTFSATGTGGATLLTSSQIELTPASDGGWGGGFTISPIGPATFGVGSGQTATYVIDWFFAIDPGPVAGSASLDMDPPSGDVTITQSYCADSYFGTSVNGAPVCVTFNELSPNTTTSPQTLSVFTQPPPGVLTTSLTFSPAVQNFASVMTTIFLNGDVAGAGCPTGVASCFDATSSTAQVVTPEPLTSLLGVGGLLGLGLLRRRRG